MQFRAEAFNILNRSNLQAQTITLYNKTGALINNAGALLSGLRPLSSRQIQLGMKFVW